MHDKISAEAQNIVIDSFIIQIQSWWYNKSQSYNK